MDGGGPVDPPIDVDLPGGQWWHHGEGGRLRMRVEAVAPDVDEDGAVSWLVLTGRRVTADGAGPPVRALVRAAALARVRAGAWPEPGAATGSPGRVVR